jgi:hypothetical protein
MTRRVSPGATNVSRTPCVRRFPLLGALVTAAAIDSAGKQLSYIGDLAHHPVLLLQKPLTEFKYDTDPKQSAQSRVKMLGMLADKKIPLLAYHFPWPVSATWPGRATVFASIQKR